LHFATPLTFDPSSGLPSSSCWRQRGAYCWHWRLLLWRLHSAPHLFGLYHWRLRFPGASSGCYCVTDLASLFPSIPRHFSC
jgi:hypothetical protein